MSNENKGLRKQLAGRTIQRAARKEQPAASSEEHMELTEGKQKEKFKGIEIRG